MTRSSSFPAPEAQICAYRVEGPRASDAIAVSLRDAFERDAGLPEEWLALLHQLNRAEVETAH